MNKNVLLFAQRSGAGSQAAGGGNDGGSGLEARVAKLEASVEHLQRDVGELRTDIRDVRDRLGRLEERVSHLPGKGFIVSTVIVGLAVVAGPVGLQGQTRSFIERPQASSTDAP